MEFDVWVNSRLGRGIDYDKVYGVQCVDLIKDYIKNVLEFEPQSIGNAIEYYRKRNTDYLMNNFIWINNSPSFVPQKGDICVFKSITGRGHVSVATGEGDTHAFYSYDENFPRGRHEPMSKYKHSYKSFLGVLRPYNQSNIKIAGYSVGYVYTTLVNLKIRNGASVNCRQKRKWELTSDGQQHCGASEYAVLLAGTRVTVKQIEYENGNTWIRIPSGWIAAIYNGKKYIK